MKYSNIFVGIVGFFISLICIRRYNAPNDISNNNSPPPKAKPTQHELIPLLRAFNDRTAGDKKLESTSLDGVWRYEDVKIPRDAKDQTIYVTFRGLGDIDLMSGKQTIMPYAWLFQRLLNREIFSVLDQDQVKQTIETIRNNNNKTINIIGFSLRAARAVNFLQNLKDEDLLTNVKRVYLGDIDPRVFSHQQAEIIRELENRTWHFKVKEDNFANNSCFLDLISGAKPYIKYDYVCEKAHQYNHFNSHIGILRGMANEDTVMIAC